eukprot:TRINITY_DN1593_c0_g1_i1.p1 TRINITY_DN1593_c0_g1~~TRINITY_DN1593_c0_g1_i1.p1  ORF type:complete len:304 (+),score=52.26 TRINITY_DN1593_c0_g1_i1:29-940(+)
MSWGSWLWSSSGDTGEGLSSSDVNWGYLGYLNSAQKQSLEQIKLYFDKNWFEYKDPLLDFQSEEDKDSFLLRFLRARNFEIEKSITMMDICLEWRKNINIAPGNLHDPHKIQKIVLGDGAESYFVDSGMVDKAGKPYLIGRTCLINNAKMDGNTHLTAVTLVLEHAMVYSLRFPVEYCSYILDLREDPEYPPNSVGSASLDILREGIHRASEYYPEGLGKVYLIGAGWAFYMLWKVMSLWITTRTKNKVVFLDQDKWKEQLLEYFDKDQLVEDFGGTGPPLGGKVFIERAVERYIHNAQNRSA